MRPTRPCDVFFITAKLAHAPFGLVKSAGVFLLGPHLGKKRLARRTRQGVKGGVKTECCIILMRIHRVEIGCGGVMENGKLGTQMFIRDKTEKSSNAL